jgi:hypothetical protein
MAAAAAPSTVATICPNKLLFRLFLAWTDAQVYDEPKLPPSHNAAVVQNRGGPPPTDTHIPRFLRDSTPGILSLDFGGVGANSIATLGHHAIGADGLSSGGLNNVGVCIGGMVNLGTVTVNNYSAPNDNAPDVGANNEVAAASHEE